MTVVPVLLVALALGVRRSAALAHVSRETVRLWAAGFDGVLGAHKRDVMRVGDAQRALDATALAVRRRSPRALLQQFAERVAAPFRDKVRAADRLAKAAREAFDAHVAKTGDGSVTSGDFDLAKLLDSALPKSKLEDLGVRLEASADFNGVEIDRERSVVKLPAPVEQAAANPGVQAALDWSKVLDATFKENLAADPTLKWQYFGSASGAYRTFPGKRWAVPPDTPAAERDTANTTDYDPRFRPWFVSSATGPKDVLVLLDVSGSMGLGQAERAADGKTRLDVAVESVQLAINSLSTADFFNVIVFSDTARPVSCFNATLARATNTNKRTVLDGLRQIEPEGGTNFRSAFNLAFDMLAASTERGLSSGCQSTILFLTDGISGDPRALIRARQAARGDGNQARIFSYSISSEADRRMAYDIARANNGAFYTVRDAAPPGQLSRIVSRYYDHYGDGFEAWSPPYFDANGLGLMVTRSVPVFVGHANASELLGVVGVDVTLSDIETVVRNELASEDSYAFLVNRDGEAIVHPRLKVHASPNFPDISLLEATASDPDERAEFVSRVRGPIVRGLDGAVRLVMPRLYSKGDASTEGVRKEYKNVTYYFSTIPNTEFTLCLALLDSFIAPRELALLPLAEWRARDAAQRRAEGAPSTDPQPAVFHALMDDVALREFGDAELAADVDLVADPADPNHPGVAVSTSHSMFTLSPSLYCDVPRYAASPCSRERTAQLQALVNTDDAELPACTDGGLVDPVVRAQVRTSQLFEPMWARAFRNDTYEHAVWVYFGTRSGVTRLYPGFQLDNTEYNPAQRFWYQRALAFPSSHSLSVPYIDAFGAGDVITLAAPMFEGSGECLEADADQAARKRQADNSTTTTNATETTTSTTPTPTTTTTTTTSTTTTTTTTTTATDTMPIPEPTDDPFANVTTIDACATSQREVLGVMGLDFKYTTLYDLFYKQSERCVSVEGDVVPCETEVDGAIVPGARMCDSDCSLSGTENCRIACFVIDASGQLVFHPKFYESPDAGQFADTFMNRLLSPLTEELAKLQPKPFLRRTADFDDWTAACEVDAPPPSQAGAPTVSAASPLRFFDWLRKRQEPAVPEWSEPQCVAADARMDVGSVADAPLSEDAAAAAAAEADYDGGETRGIRDCVQSINVYEVDASVIPADTGVLVGTVFHRCLVGEYYISPIGDDSNLYLIVMDNYEEKTLTNCLTADIGPGRTESATAQCAGGLARPPRLCAVAIDVETADRCACHYTGASDGDEEDPGDGPCDDSVQKVVDCQTHGDCVHGQCVCDPGFTDDAFCSHAAARASLALTLTSLAIARLTL